MTQHNVGALLVLRLVEEESIEDILIGKEKSVDGFWLACIIVKK